MWWILGDQAYVHIVGVTSHGAVWFALVLAGKLSSVYDHYVWGLTTERLEQLRLLKQL